MNTNSLQRRSALWRIAQIMKVDFYTQQRGMLFALGSLLLIIAALPRLLFLLPIVTYQTWCESIVSGESVYSWVTLGISAIFGGLMSLYYLNRRVQHARPIAFALLPARLWEKLTALGLFALGVYLSSMLIFTISELLNIATIEGYSSVLAGNIWNIGLLIPFSSTEWGGDAFFLQQANIAGLLSAVLVAIHFRRLRVGIFVYCLGWIALVFLGSVLALYCAGLALSYPNIFIRDTIVLAMVLLILINIGLVWGIYYRLRRIEC